MAKRTASFWGTRIFFGVFPKRTPSLLKNGPGCDCPKRTSSCWGVSSFWGERPLSRHVGVAVVVGGDLVGGSLWRGASSGRRSSLEAQKCCLLALTLLCCAWLWCAQEMRYFMTGSNAEFHDPHLRRLLAQYVRTCEGEQAASRVETDVAAWYAAVTQYKDVVTHFFAYKTEQCTIVFCSTRWVWRNTRACTSLPR